MNLNVHCPECGKEGEHVVLRESHDLLVQCPHCGHIHRIKKEKKEEIVILKTIVSEETVSKVCSVELLENEVCYVGNLLIAECDDDIAGVEVTSIETGAIRKNSAKASEITTLWARLIETVIVKASVHDGYRTLPLYQQCDGEEDFVVGEAYTFGKIRFRVTQIKLRDGAVMRKEGWKAYARKIKRIYGTRL
jgi:uncharacterized Zn finger protein